MVIALANAMIEKKGSGWLRVGSVDVWGRSQVPDRQAEPEKSRRGIRRLITSDTSQRDVAVKKIRISSKGPTRELRIFFGSVNIQNHFKSCLWFSVHATKGHGEPK